MELEMIGDGQGCADEVDEAYHDMLWPLVSIMQLAIRTEHGIIWVSMPSQGAFSVRASHTELSGWFYFFSFFFPGHPQQ